MKQDWGHRFLPYEDDRRDLPGGILGRFLGIYPRGLMDTFVHGDTGYVKYFASWDNEYHAIRKLVNKYFQKPLQKWPSVFHMRVPESIEMCKICTGIAPSCNLGFLETSHFVLKSWIEAIVVELFVTRK